MSEIKYTLYFIYPKHLKYVLLLTPILHCLNFLNSRLHTDTKNHAIKYCEKIYELSDKNLCTLTNKTCWNAFIVLLLPVVVFNEPSLC